MGSSSSIPKDKHVVVVGAGYGGTELALLLLDHGVNFTIIDCNEAMYHNVGSVRFVTGWGKKLCIPLKETFGDHFKQAKVTSVKPFLHKVTLDTGEEISYDVLILATGSSGPSPFKMAETSVAGMIDNHETHVKKVQSSDKVVVIGGGAVGVEVAAEIATDYPNKSVTLVHARQNLVNDVMNANFQKRLLEILESKKVKLVTGEKVTNLEDIKEDGSTTLITDKGTNIEADMVIISTGLTVNTEAYLADFGEVVDESGRLKVNEFLQVQGQEDVFAIGDCCNTPELKLAFLAAEHAKVVFQNLSNKYSGKALKAYQTGGQPVIMVLGLGRDSALGQWKAGYIFGEFLFRNLKSKDLMVGRFWKKLKQKQPD